MIRLALAAYGPTPDVIVVNGIEFWPGKPVDRPPAGITYKEIEAARTPYGGWSRDQLAAWGVPWPPRGNWKKLLIEQGIR